MFDDKKMCCVLTKKSIKVEYIGEIIFNLHVSFYGIICVCQLQMYQSSEKFIVFNKTFNDDK